MKLAFKVLVAIVVTFVAIQFFRPNIPSSGATAEIQAPPEVKQILNDKCYSCHSNERRLVWFDEIQPGYWLVRKDILAARSSLNFSTIGSQPVASQKGTLYEAVNMIQLGAMPLPRFVALHPEAKVTPQELMVLKSYLSPWSNATSAKPESDTKPASDAAAAPTPFVRIADATPEHNGLKLDAGLETWKLISVTDRGDNNTLRLILGNGVAMRAMRAGNIQPWPDGAKIAKVAFQKGRGPDGLIHPGKFVQIELMAKDAQLYRSTEGWGWGRWRGSTLQPYGTSTAYLKECTGCHLPVKGNDNVYTLPISQVHIAKEETINNAAAALPESLPYHPLNWAPVTMLVDPVAETVAVLFGNDSAANANASRANNDSQSQIALPEGAVLALVTWHQRDDPHWFSARIPSDPVSVEFLTAAAKQVPKYQRFDGRPLTARTQGESATAERTKAMLGFTPAQYPH